MRFTAVALLFLARGLRLQTPELSRVVEEAKKNQRKPTLVPASARH